MEATIQANNQAINIDINVSINVGALKENIQRGLQAIKQRVLTATKQATKVCCNVGAAAWTKVRTVDVWDVLLNLWIGGWSVVCFYILYMYA